MSFFLIFAPLYFSYVRWCLRLLASLFGIRLDLRFVETVRASNVDKTTKQPSALLGRQTWNLFGDKEWPDGEEGSRRFGRWTLVRNTCSDNCLNGTRLEILTHFVSWAGAGTQKVIVPQKIWH